MSVRLKELFVMGSLRFMQLYKYNWQLITNKQTKKIDILEFSMRVFTKLYSTRKKNIRIFLFKKKNNI